MKEVKIANISKTLLSCNKLTCTDTLVDVPCNHVTKSLDCEVWHRRMGHIPYRRLKLLPLDIDFNNVQ